MTDAAGEEARRRTLEWLRPRLERVPEELAGAVRDCVRRASGGEAGPEAAASPRAEGPPAAGGATPEGGPGATSGRTSVPGLLARAAVEEFDRVGCRREDREAAVRLLAADACLTYGFEAAAELDADVPGLADAIGLQGRIGARLAEILGEPGAADDGTSDAGGTGGAAGGRER